MREHSCERLHLEETRKVRYLVRREWDERGGKVKEDGRKSDGEGEERQSRLIYLIASPGLQPGFNASPSGRS